MCICRLAVPVQFLQFSPDGHYFASTGFVSGLNITQTDMNDDVNCGVS